MSSRAGLDELEKRETSCPCPIRTPYCPGRNIAINVNYFTRALNIMIKTPARGFLKTSACRLIHTLLPDLINDSPWRRTCNFDGLLFKRTETTEFSSYLFSPDYLFCVMFAQIVFKDCYQEGNDTVSVFLYPALNFASADTQ